MDSRPAFSIRSLPAPAKPDGKVKRHMCFSMDYPYAMQQKMAESGSTQYKYTKYTDYIKGDANGCKDVDQDSIQRS